MQQNGNPEEEIIDFLNRNRECSIIIISDEIGNGIVPADAFEREYRERTGRILARLASRADEVVRILCGIEQRIK
jgi:adenosyl cobinamide kinase/adenosyl cobinamide phosphate guanylyltransferase